VTKASKEGGEVYMGGQGAHVGAKRAKYAKNKNNIYRVRNVPKYKRATQARLALGLKPRIPELFSDSNSGHIQVVNQKKNNLLRRGEKALYNKSLEGISEPF
jgi:hypothetical protein